MNYKVSDICKCKQKEKLSNQNNICIDFVMEREIVCAGAADEVLIGVV